MWTTVESPLGALRLVGDGRSLTALDFLEDTSDAVSASMRRAADRVERAAVGERVDQDPVLCETARQLVEYFDRARTVFDLPLDPVGTPFQRRVWEALRAIPYGQVASYSEVARRLGMSGQAARAVGLANGRNPIPVVVPCHRVVGAGGALTGYGGGVSRKRLLLDLEQGALPLEQEGAGGSLGRAPQ